MAWGILDSDLHMVVGKELSDSGRRGLTLISLIRYLGLGKKVGEYGSSSFSFLFVTFHYSRLISTSASSNRF